MKHPHLFSSLLLSAFCILASCQSKPTEIQVIDIDNPSGSIDLKISDLLDDITIVPLETRDDLLLSTARGSFMVTNHFILANTGEKLLQFDRKGNYIRTLANRGNGPNEFTYIMTSLVDEQRNILYYTDSRGNVPPTCIDLNTGKFLEFPNPDLLSSTIRQIDAEGNIYGFASSTATNVVPSSTGGISVVSGGLMQKNQDTKALDTIVLAYKYNPSDHSTTTFQARHNFDLDDRSRITFRQGDHINFLYLSYSDTLFNLDGNRMNPQYVIKLKKQMTNMREGGTSLSFPLSGTWGTVISQTEGQVIIGENSISVLRKTLAFLFLSKKGELGTIKSITIDPIAFTIDIGDYLKLMTERRSSEVKIDPTPKVSGVWAHYSVEASNMIELMDNALKSNQLSTAQRKTLEEIAAKIDDDSNPVLIIGKIK